MKNLSKSKLIAYKQCPKRLWLQVHKSELQQDSAATMVRFNSGAHMGAVAQMLYDPAQTAETINIEETGFSAAFVKTRKALAEGKIIFEAGFSAAGAMAFADVLIPVSINNETCWNIVEVKSSTQVKDCHHDDAAIQAFVAQQTGVKINSISIAHIDSN